MRRILLPAIILLSVLFSAACQPLQQSKPVQEAAWTPLFAGTSAPTAIPTKAVPRPDAWIAFIKENNVWLIRPDGSDLTQITDNLSAEEGEIRKIGELKWSPDGKRLAFTYGANGIFNIQLLNAETFKTGKLVLETGGGFDWSTSGGEVIFDTPVFTKSSPLRSVGLRVVKLNDRTKRSIFQTAGDLDSPARPQWSFDNKYLLTTSVSAGSQDRLLVDMGSKKTSSLLQAIGPVEMCDWGPMEPVLACLREASTGPGQLQHRITVVDVNGNVLTDIPIPAGWDPVYLKWSPDARRIAVEYSQDAAPTETAILSLGTRALRPLSRGGSPGWSADGRWITAVEKETSSSASPHILVVNADSGESYPLADGYAAAWQPSGQPIGMEYVAVPTETLNVSLYSTPLPDPFLSVMDTLQGDMLQVRSGGGVIELGPLEKGNFAIGPNRRFYVYCTNSGSVFVGRFGQEGLDMIGSVREFSIIRRDGTPKFTFVFLGDDPYRVQVTDVSTGENKVLPIPHGLSEGG